MFTFSVFNNNKSLIQIDKGPSFHNLIPNDWYITLLDKDPQIIRISARNYIQGMDCFVFQENEIDWANCTPIIDPTWTIEQKVAALSTLFRADNDTEISIYNAVQNLANRVYNNFLLQEVVAPTTYFSNTYHSIYIMSSKADSLVTIAGGQSTLEKGQSLLVEATDLIQQDVSIDPGINAIVLLRN